MMALQVVTCRIWKTSYEVIIYEGNTSICLFLKAIVSHKYLRTGCCDNQESLCWNSTSEILLPFSNGQRITPFKSKFWQIILSFARQRNIERLRQKSFWKKELRSIVQYVCWINLSLKYKSPHFLFDYVLQCHYES